MIIKNFFYFCFPKLFTNITIKKIANLMLVKKKTLFLIESVTCGKIASEFGKINGASNFFLGSLLIYGKIAKKTFFSWENNYLSFDYCKSSIETTKKKIYADIFLSISGNIGKNLWENQAKGSFFLVIFDNCQNKYFFYQKKWNLFYFSRKKCQKILTLYTLSYLWVILKNSQTNL